MAKKPTTSEILDQIKRDMFKDVMKPVEMLTLEELVCEMGKRCTSLVIAYEGINRKREYFQNAEMAGSPMACLALAKMVSDCISSNYRESLGSDDES